MENLQDNLNSNVDAEFISEEKTESIFGTTMARAAVVQSLFENEITKKNVSTLHFKKILLKITLAKLTILCILFYSAGWKFIV